MQDLRGHANKRHYAPPARKMERVKADPNNDFGATGTMTYNDNGAAPLDATKLLAERSQGNRAALDQAHRARLTRTTAISSRATF